MHPHIRPIKSVAKFMDGRCSILNIRVRVSSTNGNLAQIFGFPPQEYFPKSMWYAPPELGRDGPYIKYLLGQSSASIKYVMGDDWHSRLQSDTENLLTGSRKGDIIFHPSVNANDSPDSHSSTQDGLAVLEEERAHSLRMHRCGAVTICAESDIWLLRR